MENSRSALTNYLTLLFAFLLFTSASSLPAHSQRRAFTDPSGDWTATNGDTLRVNASTDGFYFATLSDNTGQVVRRYHLYPVAEGRRLGQVFIPPNLHNQPWGEWMAGPYRSVDFSTNRELESGVSLTLISSSGTQVLHFRRSNIPRPPVPPVAPPVPNPPRRDLLQFEPELECYTSSQEIIEITPESWDLAIEENWIIDYVDSDKPELAIPSEPSVPYWPDVFTESTPKLTLELSICGCTKYVNGVPAENSTPNADSKEACCANHNYDNQSMTGNRCSWEQSPGNIELCGE